MRNMRTAMLGSAVCIATVASAPLLRAQHGIAEAAEPTLTGASVQQYFVDPNKPAKLMFKSVSPGQLKYSVSDYWGKAEQSGEATVDADGQVSFTLTLPAGYHEMKFADRDQSFGIVALPPHDGAADPYFGIDAALSWLESDADARLGMIAMMKRSGIGFARERMGWANVYPAEGAVDFETKRQFDTVRQAYAAQNVGVLDMIDGAPGQFKSPEAPTAIRYIDRLGPGAAAWEKIATHYSPAWNGLEISNEPELTPWPADQYVPLAKMTAYAHQQAGLTTPLGGGVFGGNAPSAFHDVCAASGLLDSCDFVSFHSYDKASSLSTLIGQYREWLNKAGKASMPLWLTEAGKPWTLGPPRAPIGEDADCAAAMAGLVTEGRANGIARICPFVLPYYNEGGLKSFSMMGKERSPMRILGGYINSIRMLSGRAYVGDVSDISGAESVRVFDAGEQSLLVIRTSALNFNATVKIDLPVTRVEGIDGRAMAITDNIIPVPDGIAYAWADKAAVAKVLKTDTPAMRLYALAQQPAPKRGVAPAVVLQHPLASEKGKMSPRRYLLDAATARALPLTVRVDNMSAAPQSVTLTPHLPGEPAATIAPQTVDIPPLGHATAQWTIDTTNHLDMAELRCITITGQTAAGELIAPMAIPYQTEGELAEHLQRNAYQLKLPITNLDRWKPNIVGHGKMRMSIAGDAFRFDATYTKPGERWAYPRFAINIPIDPARARGVLLRARILKPGSNVAVMMMQSGQPGFWAMEVFPADGQWHVCYVPFSDLRAMPGNPDMQNAIINPAKFTEIQVGMKSADADNAMEVSNLLIVGPK